MIGERTAESMKITIGTAYKRDDNTTMEVRGRDLITGLPKNLTVHSEEIAEALMRLLQLCRMYSFCFRKTPRIVNIMERE